MRIALGLEYDGRLFSGWQTQPDGRTVQDALETALAEIACHPVKVIAAGRTDAGVHASEQVVHFETRARRQPTAWVRGVNRFLPAGVAVLWAQEVSDEFHARFSASARSYSYYLLNHPVRPGLASGRVGWFHAPLDLSAMREAACRLLGTHDFSSFRAAECQARTPVRSLARFDIDRSGDLIRFDLRADAFLHHMVRNLVGALVYVGKGAYEPAWISSLLAERDRRRAPPTFMPDGLYLTGVTYPLHFGLPQAGGRIFF